MDEIDLAIVSILQYNGRMPFTKIAVEVGVSEGAVRQRVKRMTDSGTLQIVGIVEPQHLGMQEAGMIAVSVRPNQIEEVAHQIAQFPEVSYLFMAAGEFDLFVEFYCRDKESFVSFLNDKLLQVPGIERTQTFPILKMFKLSYRWGEAEPPRMNHRLPIPPPEKTKAQEDSTA